MPQPERHYDSGCRRTHDFYRQCRACFKHKCSKCKVWNEVDASKCWNCGALLPMTRGFIRKTTHPEGTTRCPIAGCGTMLRIKPRDKRRAEGKKKRC